MQQARHPGEQCRESSRTTFFLSTELSDWDKSPRSQPARGFSLYAVCGRNDVAQPFRKDHQYRFHGRDQRRSGTDQLCGFERGPRRLYKSLCRGASGKGIQVNAVLPGMIVTGMSTRVRKRAGEEILDRIPCGRFGEPKEVAYLVLVLGLDPVRLHHRASDPGGRRV